MPGAVYHVYNRVARGGHRFWEEGADGRLLAGIPERKKPDEFVVMVDRVMSNHWHLAVGMGHVPLEGRYGFLVKSMAVACCRSCETASRGIRRGKKEEA